MTKEQFHPDASCHITNNVILLVMLDQDNPVDAGVYSMFIDAEGVPLSSVVRSIIHYTSHSGAPYFERYRHRYYLSDFVKCSK